MNFAAVLLRQLYVMF